MHLYNLPDTQKEFVLHRFEGFPVEGVTLVDTSASLTAAVVLDTETTGLDTSVDEIIEIAARLIHYDKSTGTICRVGPAFQALQQPTQPLSENIQRITGLTDEMLAGQSIDWDAFCAFCTDAQLLISHNAAFDRPFVDRFSIGTRSAFWACSFIQIPWSDWFPVAKQEVLTIYHGFFYTGHRALIDVDALLNLLSLPMLDQPDCSYFSTLLSNARKPFVYIAAVGSPFETKDLLSKHRYKWNPAAKTWHKTVPVDALDAEQSFLAKEIYPSGQCEAEITHIPIHDNFKPL
jgi:DNA polymerase-3 subunit epsilon